MSAENNRTVSFEDEPLILVNAADEVVGYKSKLECHRGSGILHRAFSIFIFNDRKQLLLQRRSEQKQLWPLYWSNSVCSHPRKGETMDIAIRRRLQEELGFWVPLQFLYKFQYQAGFNQKGSENEVCSVYIGKYTGPIRPNRTEIAGWKFGDGDVLEKDITEHPNAYTPWFRMEWERIRKEFWKEVETL